MKNCLNSDLLEKFMLKILFNILQKCDGFWKEMTHFSTHTKIMDEKWNKTLRNEL